MKNMHFKNICILLTFALFCVTIIGCGKNKSSEISTELLSVDQDEQDTTGSEIISEEDATEDDAMEDDTMERITNYQHKDGETAITYIGHASVKITTADGRIIYIDPNYEGDYSDEADYILITHSHDDHQPRKEVTLKDNGTIISYKEALVDGEYKVFEYDNLKIEAVPAGGNPNHNIKFCVGYIVTVDDIVIYHAGDTSKIDQMAELAERKIDYAMYPIDGIYNMDAEEATEVAGIVGAAYNIPIHELDDNSEKKSDNFKAAGKLVLNYGDTIIVGGMQ